MTTRRDVLIGVPCALAAGAVYALKPRRFISLMPPKRKLSEILPFSFEGWISRDVSDLVAPETPDSLAARLYGETVGRIYRQESTGAEVIMLMAHGDQQSNELQLHRPEVCYPAFGFTLIRNMATSIGLGGPVSVPGRLIVAHSMERQETILYWTRLGEAFPTTVSEQRWDRLRTSVHRYIADGLLARFSVVGEDINTSLQVMEQFIPSLIGHVAANARRSLVGTARSLQFASRS